MAHRIGCDVGGTFTDLCLVEPELGRAFFAKFLTTPQDQALAVAAAARYALDGAAVPGASVTGFAHGTTVATNAILERKGARTALVTTRGFRDVLLIGTQMRPHLYDARVRRPPPLVPRSLTFEIDERVDAAGNVVVPADAAAIESLCETLTAQSVESVAVVLLHSFANPAHERLVREVLEQRVPDMDVSLSSEVLPVPGEYARASTTVMNAYLMPPVRGYLRSLGAGLEALGITASPMIMQSNGGLMTVATASTAKSVHTSLSGPAAGLIAARRFAESAGHPDAVAVDMGGTSFDVGLIRDGDAELRYEGEIEGYPIRIPMFDIVTLGAGGGSIAAVDPGGLLTVGPRSAGARPGPAAYGMGGDLPTVTDANVVLGRLRAGRHLASIAIDAQRARRAVGEHVGEPLGMSPEAAADGILQVVTAAMVRGIRRVTVERGIDPRNLTLFAFGGAGPLHAVDIAAQLDMQTVIIPPSPGLLCAIGLLISPWRHHEVAVVGGTTTTLSERALSTTVRRLEDRARAQADADHVVLAKVALAGAVDLRYAGQGHPITVPFGGLGLADAVAAFHAAHRRSYGFDRTDHPVECVNVRVIASAPPPSTDLPLPVFGNGENPVVGEAAVMIAGRPETVPVIERVRLAPGCRLSGPALIEQADSTVYVDRRELAVDDVGNLLIDMRT